MEGVIMNTEQYNELIDLIRCVNQNVKQIVYVLFIIAGVLIWKFILH